MVKKINYKKKGFFRFRSLNDKVVITNDVGDLLALDKKDFDLFLNDQLDNKSKLYKSLKDRHFIASKDGTDELIERYGARKEFLLEGPSLHIIVVTLRCNHNCVYCHASSPDKKDEAFNMKPETAKKVLDRIFESPNKNLAIEFQGGEPLCNWPVVEFVVKEAKKRAQREKKSIEFRLVSNLTLMNDEKLNFLIKNKVNICTSLDGPEELHNKNRPIGKTGGHKTITSWIKKINKIYKNKKLSAIPVVSKHSLKLSKKIIDEYIDLGFENIFFRPLNPFGMSNEDWKKIGVTATEYLKFYKEALDYIIDLNRRGKKIKEKSTEFYLRKILTDNDPNYLEMRSPCGAGIGQMAYNFDGDVYTCDEGRMMSQIGDESFRIGNVHENEYEDMVTHTTVKTLCTASCLENLAGCSDCAYLPYCGVCPIYNYFEQGNIYAQMAKNDRCKISMGILDYLVLKLEDKEINNIFKTWIKK